MFEWPDKKMGVPSIIPLSNLGYCSIACTSQCAARMYAYTGIYRIAGNFGEVFNLAASGDLNQLRQLWTPCNTIVVSTTEGQVDAY